MYNEDVHNEDVQWRCLSGHLNMQVQTLALLGNTPLTLPPNTLSLIEINIIG